MPAFLGNAIGLIPFILVPFVPFLLWFAVRADIRNRGAKMSGQAASLELLDKTAPDTSARFRVLAPGEDFLLAIPAARVPEGGSRKRPRGWLVASSRRVWWISFPGRANAEEAEIAYDCMANIAGVPLGSMPTLTLGDTSFRATRENATALSQVIRRQRDVVAAQPTATISASEAPGQLGVADELVKLAALRDSGVLTSEEFDKRKRVLLG